MVNYPKEIAGLRQWICWRLEPDPKSEKPRKIPYYQYFVEYKNSEPEIYVIRDGKRIAYADIKKEIEIL